ncbi:thioredoxin [Cynoglossus semilaevis]|uniref:Thioredoxin n=1 Tax=Cynoglossus semilaevis TaxID=244447 RepID=I3VA01_CYNSE|nr:thioredoxin [Cynoglossus semilaevis]AFK76078.1 thioredoxin [Cynoglossus semilaevis]
MVYEVKDYNDFTQQLKRAGNKLVVVDFTATWCQPCKNISPVFEELANQYKNVVFLKVDVDEADDVSTECEINCMPTFLFYRNEKRVHSFSGANSDTLRAAVKQYEKE